jgi:hypothetical protein
LLELAALLRFDGERGRGAREKSLDADGLSGLLAETVAAVLDAGERLVDLLEELAFAVARAKLEGVLLLQRGAVGRIRREGQLARVLGRGARILAQLGLQLDQPLAEEFDCAAFMYSDFGILTISASVRVLGLLAIDPSCDGPKPRAGKASGRAIKSR